MIEKSEVQGLRHGGLQKLEVREIKRNQKKRNWNRKENPGIGLMLWRPVKNMFQMLLIDE